jgi:hypothetical protein
MMITGATCDLLALSRSLVPGWWSCRGRACTPGRGRRTALNDFETIGK